MARGRDIAFATASGVMALKVTRSTGTPFKARLALKASTMCQEIASPSRSCWFREDETVRALHPSRDFGDVLGALGLDLPFHGEVILGITEPSFGGRSRMPERRGRRRGLAQIFI